MTRETDGARAISRRGFLESAVGTVSVGGFLPGRDSPADEPKPTSRNSRPKRIAAAHLNGIPQFRSFQFRIPSE